MKHKSFRLASFKALDDAKGIFEAIVAVFNNVDRIGDKIMPGAFKDTLAEWEAKGRPIPVIFSHQWENLDAHVGQVVTAKEIDEGLYVKAQLDMDEPFAQRVWKKMKTGTLAEFSFAYDVVDAAEIKENGNWIQELRKLDLLEVGPCLVGMNPETALLGMKDFTFEHIFLNYLARLEAGESVEHLLTDTLSRKEGRRNATKDAARIQTIHDLTLELGAKCAEPSGDSDEDGDEAGDGKSIGKSGTLAERVAIELLELGIE